MIRNTTMGLALALALALACAPGCGDDASKPDPEEVAQSTWEQCQDTDPAFVRRSIAAVLGRTAWSSAEVAAWSDTLAGFRASLPSEEDARRAVISAMSRDPEYLRRWSNFFMDQLQATRQLRVRDSTYGVKAVESCFDAPAPTSDGGVLATFVRDNAPSASAPPIPDFSLGQLLASSLALDDISPLYRANIFHFLQFPLPGADVAPDELERARRTDAGSLFESVYLHRDLACLPCHNSDFSVTATDDPATSRAFPLPGSFERALYGDSAAGSDPLVYRSMFRVDGVVADRGSEPWGWNASRCGSFQPPTTDDPLGVVARFGTVAGDNDPVRARRASVWALEAGLHRGVDRLRVQGLAIGADGALDPDDAFAYLVGARIVLGVWSEMVGTDLTIANYFPRNAEQRNTLASLTDDFVRSGFSLRTLIGDIAVHPAFNLAPPDRWCTDELYALPPLLDPFTKSEQDVELQKNSTADRLAHVNARVLLRRTHLLLSWPEPPAFPDDDAAAQQIAIGVFNSGTDPGFRGMDFQARLQWEQTAGSCKVGDEPDFIDSLVTRGVASGATLGAAVEALQDRLLGTPEVTTRAAVETLVEASLDRPLEAGDAEPLRRVCSAFLESTSYLLQGFPEAEVPDEEPALLPAEATRAASCAAIEELLSASGQEPASACPSL